MAIALVHLLNLEELVELPEYSLHIYALYLLAQFKVPQAYPLIIEFFSAPGDILQVAGNIVIENLGRIFANVSGGNPEPLKKLVENPQVNESVRGAALTGLVALVVQEILSRELIIQYFEELFSTRLEQERCYETEPSHIWTYLVISSARLYPLELKPHIERAFESDLIDPLYINSEHIERYLQLGQDATLNQLRSNRYYAPIKDTVAELERWTCFQEKQEKRVAQKRNKPLGLGKLNQSAQKKTGQVKKKARKKMQKQARRKNR